MPAPLSIIALHGSGADETTVIPLARAVDPDATIIAPRGRIDQNGERRWFRKLTPTSFDQQSIREEALAFAGFLDGLRRESVIGSVAQTLVIGYSNGGNLAHSVMLLHPGRIAKLALLRCMPVLKRAPMTELTGASVLVRGWRVGRNLRSLCREAGGAAPAAGRFDTARNGRCRSPVRR